MKSIGASPAVHTYTVTFNVNLDLDDDIGDNEYEPCADVCNPRWRKQRVVELSEVDL